MSAEQTFRPERPLVYVAGPIAGDPHGCVKQAVDAFHVLRPLGCTPFLPQLGLLQSIVSPHRMGYEDWMAYDFDIIDLAEALVRLPGHSPGAEREVVRANARGIPVFHYDSPSFPGEFESWLLQRREG
jgi:hypothetical protein